MYFAEGREGSCCRNVIFFSRALTWSSSFPHTERSQTLCCPLGETKDILNDVVVYLTMEACRNFAALEVEGRIGKCI